MHLTSMQNYYSVVALDVLLSNLCKVLGESAEDAHCLH